MDKPKVTYASAQCITCAEITIALLEDTKNKIVEYGEKDFSLDKAEVIKRSAHEGISFFCRTLPNLAKGLLTYLETGKGSYPNFGKLRYREYPSFMKGLFAVAYDHNSINQALAIGSIYQIGNAFKKLKGPYPKAVLHRQMEDFILTDDQLLHNFTEADELIIKDAQDYITSLFQPINEDQNILFDGIRPKPGPGATNTPVLHHNRYRFETYYESLASFFDYDEWFYATYHEYAWDIPRFREKYLNKRAHPLARFKFVDKVVGKARGICIEENEPQYLQQGVKTFLYKWIENHPLTKGKVNFQSQDINRDIALRSSLDQAYATLDMSEASDRVSKHIVSVLFEGVPLLRDCLLSLATPEVDVSGYSLTETIKLNKYAPMGSGLCFPIMSLVHWALCRSIIRNSMQRSQLDEVYVYGDDIVVPSPSAQAIFDWLPRFGMKLNKDKSFVESAFRESCGIHAYRGVDITPVYFKYIPVGPLKIAAVPSIIANEALLYTQGKMCTATYLRKKFWKKLPYVGNQSAAIGWKRPIDDPLIALSVRERVRRRWDVDTQQYLYKYSVLRQDRSEDSGAELGFFPEHEAYLRWFAVRPEIIHDKGQWNNAPIRRAIRWISLGEVYGKSVDFDAEAWRKLEQCDGYTQFLETLRRTSQSLNYEM